MISPYIHEEHTFFNLLRGFKHMAFMTSISYMGCHPNPIDFHSIMFQDGEIAPPSTYPNYTYVIQPVTLWLFNIAMEYGHRNSGFSH